MNSALHRATVEMARVRGGWASPAELRAALDSGLLARIMNLARTDHGLCSGVGYIWQGSNGLYCHRCKGSGYRYPDVASILSVLDEEDA